MRMTSNLRKYDVGYAKVICVRLTYDRILVMGTDLSSIKLPPKRQEYEIYGTCTSEWTSLLPFPVKMFQYGTELQIYYLLTFCSATHAHRLGRQIWTEQYRDEKLIRIFGAPHYGMY